jgi:hypothetical protein
MTLTGPLLSLLPALENLGLGTSPHGRCSPLAPLPEGWPGAPEGATSVVWAYPIEGMAALLADGKATSGTGASTGGRHGALRAAAAAAAAASAVVSDATAGGGKGKWNLAAPRLPVPLTLARPLLRRVWRLHSARQEAEGASRAGARRRPTVTLCRQTCVAA